MANAKRLAINDKPEILSYSSHAKTLAILSTDKHYEAWFHSNYIQLICEKDFKDKGIHLDFYLGPSKDFNFYVNNPWLYSQTIKKEMVNHLTDNITEFVISCIDRNYYVDLHLDQHFVAKDPSFHFEPHQFYHDTLVFGYNRSEQYFDILGYNPFYKSLKISFSDFDSAYRNCPIEKWYTVLYLYHYEKKRPGSQSKDYILDVTWIADSLKGYLNSTDHTRLFAMFDSGRNNLAFGMDVYHYYKLNFKSGDFWEDIRPLYVLWEHKKCMLSRIQYLYDHHYLIQSSYAYLKVQFEEIKNLAEFIKVTQLKALISKDNKIIEKIIFNCLDEIASKEHKAINELITALELPLHD